MNKKILIGLVILVLIVLSGCLKSEHETFCESIGYSDWNWLNRVSGDDRFFCYIVDCDNITTSKLFLDMEDAKGYNDCNTKPSCD